MQLKIIALSCVIIVGTVSARHFIGGITMIIVFDNRNIDIDNISFFEFFFAGYAVTDNIVNAGAN
jgi:hypothetical protein